MDAGYPTVRFFVSGSGAAALSIVYKGLAIPTGTVVATRAWAPSPVEVTLSAVPGLLGGGTANASPPATDRFPRDGERQRRVHRPARPRLITGPAGGHV